MENSTSYSTALGYIKYALDEKTKLIDAFEHALKTSISYTVSVRKCMCAHE